LFSRQRRLLAMACVAVILLAVVFTYSRAAFIALAMVSVLIMYDLNINPTKVVMVVIPIIIVILLLLPPNYVNRLLTLEEATSAQSNEQSLKGRYSELIVAIQMFLDHPIIGVGVGNYSAHYQEYSTRLGIDDRSQAREAHNYYTELAAEKGFVGIVAFVIMLIAIFNSIRRSKRQLQEIGRLDLIPWICAVQYGFISYLFTSLFLHDSYSRYFWLLVAFIAAGAAMTEALVKKHQQQLEEANYDFSFPTFKVSTE
jgi:putative inorganic carbon (HCO3(-)) transporter